MEQIILKLVEQLNSSVFVLISILFFAGYLAYKMGAWKQIFFHHTDRLEKIESMKDSVIEIKTKVDLIYQYSNPNSPVRSQSPVSLTDIGKEIQKKINALEIFQNYAVKLIGMVEGKNPQTAYDIQQTSFEVAKRELIKLLNEDELKMVKNEAFNRGILVEDIMGIFGVLLRNKILEDKKLSIADVDKNLIP
ncbi:MAG: hypothetical protein ACHQYQ_09155 [Bacteriovoracales bacterium]